MNKVILVAHGKLAHEMKNSAEMIFGALPEFESVAFLKEEGLDTLQEKIAAAMTDRQADYLVLTDLFCGTPYNASCSVALKNPQRKMDVVSGMSLPIVLEVASMLGSSDLDTIVNHATSIPCEIVKAFKQQVIEEEEDF